MKRQSRTVDEILGEILPRFTRGGLTTLIFKPELEPMSIFFI